MGWSGYSIYSGDDTQTQHYDFLVKAKVVKNDDEIFDGEWLTCRGTIIPKHKIPLFIKNIGKIKLRVPKFWDEDSAIEHQMLLALFVDNKLPVPRNIFDNGIIATEYLMGGHAADFDKPSLRRAALKRFIVRAKKLKIAK